MPPRKPKASEAKKTEGSPFRDYSLSLSTDRKGEGYMARLQVEDKMKGEVVLTLEASLVREGNSLNLNLQGSEVDLWELVLKLLDSLTD